MPSFQTNSFYLVSLGCAKNSVDSDSMAILLQQAGYTPVEKTNPRQDIDCQYVWIYPTSPAEIYQVLTDLAAQKKRGQVLIAAGCLTERYRQEIAERIPGVDGILGTRRWMDIVEVVQKLRSDQPNLKTIYHLPDSATIGKDEHGVLRASIQGTSAYLKIADGCRRPCAFCAIPLIKGTVVSRPPEVILAEAKHLQELGIQEINLIAQDTTDYGHDLGMQDGLADLLEGIVQSAPQIPWIRILYAYPGYVTDHLIEVMARNSQILPYLDLPLQHAHPQTLKRMRRPANMDWVYKTLQKMRSALPGLALRTTFIVGYPGETESEFQTLLDFITEIKFDHVGAFIFSFEPGTASESLGDPIPRELKEERLERLMLLQQGISLTRNQGLIGKTLPVLVEGFDTHLAIGRSYRDAPEIDGLVLIEDRASVGEIVPVHITGAMAHDLVGRLAKKSP